MNTWKILQSVAPVNPLARLIIEDKVVPKISKMLLKSLILA